MIYLITHFFGENKIDKIIVCESEKVRELFDCHCSLYKNDDNYNGSTCIKQIIQQIDVSELNASECKKVMNDIKADNKFT
jgi:ferredoxin-thioredoxin reductase catalytic subunit